jgi:uncharacterized protein (TIGR02001 family)
MMAGVSIFGLSLACATTAFAAAGHTWTFNLGATSDYKFRGISQTAEDPAVQGSVEWAHNSGFFLNVWGSNVDFAPSDPGAEVELDLTAGYVHEFNENTSATAKVIYYWYPGADTDDANYWELIASATHNFGAFSGSVLVAYTPDYYGGTDSGVYIAAGVEAPINDWLGVSANLGQQSFDDNGAVGIPDYITWDFGATLTYQMFSFDLRYIGADIDEPECYGGSDVCQDKVVATLNFEYSTAEE